MDMVTAVIKLLFPVLALANRAFLVQPDYSDAAVISPGYSLQFYLCGNGSLLHSNMTVALESGEHLIPSGPFCFVSNVSNVLITGSPHVATTIRCQGERGFGFIEVTNITIEHISIIGCGQSATRISETQTVPAVIYLEQSFDIVIRKLTLTRFRGIGVYGYNLHKTSMSEVVFDGCAINTSCSASFFEVSHCDTDQSLQPDTMLTIESCICQSLLGVAKFSTGISLRCIHARVHVRDCVFDDLGGTSIGASRVNISIENSTFVGNRANDLIMEDSNTNILQCRFNGHRNKEAISIMSTGSVTTFIAESVFQNYSIGVLDIRTGAGNTRVMNCTFDYNGASTIKLLQTGIQLPMATSQDSGPVVCVEVSKCNFTNNRPGAVSISTKGDSVNVLNCSNVITDCTFYQNDVSDSMMEGILNLHITIMSNIVDENSDMFGSFSMHLYVYISRCLFEKNIGQLITITIKSDEKKVPVSFALTDCSFLHNAPDHGLGSNTISISGGHIEDTYIYETVQIESIVITMCTFEKSAVGAVRLFGVSGSFEFDHCNFTENGHADVLEFSSSDTSFYNVSISRCVFKMNNAQSISMYFRSFDDEKMPASLAVKECSFLHNTFDDGTKSSGFAISMKTKEILQPTVKIESIVITGCTFQGNSGGAVQLSGVIGNTEFKNCTILENNAGTNAVLYIYVLLSFKSSHLFWNISISRCIFEMNKGQLYIYIASDKEPKVPVSFEVKDCQFLHNKNELKTDNNGIMMINMNAQEAESFVITGCIFQGNSGSAVILHSVSGNIEFDHCNFTNNNASYGAGLAIVHNQLQIDHTLCTVSVRNSNFINNTAVTGAAIYFVNGDFSNSGKLTLIDVVIQGSHCGLCDLYTRMRGGAMYVERTSIDIVGKQGSEFTSNAPQGALQGSNIEVSLYGKVSFTNNTGENGGAISILNNGGVTFNPCKDQDWNECKSILTFSGNKATKFGGAIYVAGKMDIYTDINNKKCAVLSQDSIRPQIITFSDNYAQLAGHTIYASPIYWCSLHDESSYVHYKLRDVFEITPITGTSKDSQIVSFPTYVKICCESQELCDFSCQHLISSFPGSTVRICMSLVDYGSTLSPGIIYTQIEECDSASCYHNVRLGDHQNAQWVEKNCSILEYQIYGPENATFYLSLSSYPAQAPTAIRVNLMQCIPWFRLVTDPKGFMKCDCLQFWAIIGLVCDNVNGTVMRKGKNWIGLYTNESQLVPAFAITCPLNYCTSNFTHVSLKSPEEDVCNERRTGILCGQCHGNYSIIFGSSGCHECTNVWLITILMYAILGASLVVLLFILNFTVTQGTLYGFIFYANVIQVNASIFFNDSVLVPLQIMISFINLDLGFPLCFYDGMDDAAKTGLQFAFPAYLLTITITVIAVCHYFLSRSTHPSGSRNCLGRISCLVGQRATGVLSTLIFLSYSKLLRTVVDIFLFSTLYTPDGSVLIWFYDGNIEYLHGRHLVLFIIAMVISILFIIPYTLALTFIPIIEHFSENNEIFHCLYKLVNRIKPMNDAHYAPFKGGWRWWLGVRLWFLIFMFTLNPVYSSENPPLLLLIHGTTMIGFILVQSIFQPFEVQMLTNDCKGIKIFNWFYNWLDLFSLLNYTLLALSVSYIVNRNTDPAQINIAIGMLVGLFCVVFSAAVLFHIIVAFLKVCNKYDPIKEKIVSFLNHLFSKKPAAIEEEQLIEIDAIDTNGCTVREPLLLEDF